MASQTSRDLPTPASATSATTCPWPARARASARSIAARSSCRPTNGVRPRAADCLEPGPGHAGADQLVDLDRLLQPLDRRRPERPHLDEPLGQRQGGRAEQGGARRSRRPSIREARWTVWPIAV